MKLFKAAVVSLAMILLPLQAIAAEEGNVAKAIAHIKAEEYDAAARLLKPEMERSPDDPIVTYLYGMSLNRWTGLRCPRSGMRMMPNRLSESSRT